jgi:hypothetical protein
VSTPAGNQSVDSIFSGPYRALTLGIISVLTIAAFDGLGVNPALPAAAQHLTGLPL